MIKESLDILLARAKVQDFDKDFEGLNGTLVKLITQHFHLLSFKLETRRTRDFDHKWAVLIITCGKNKFKLPVPELKKLVSEKLYQTIRRKIMSQKLIKKTETQIASELGVDLKFVKAAYFLRMRINTPETGNCNASSILMPDGSYKVFRHVYFDGEKFYEPENHPEQTEDFEISLKAAIMAVNEYEEARAQTIRELRKEGYKTLITALLAEEGLAIEKFKDNYVLFNYMGGKLNSGNGIRVEKVFSWEEANVVIFHSVTGYVMRIFVEETQTNNFYSGYGLSNSKSIRRWTVGEHIW